jgi:DeoR/GlpR family transcriptional regulator of sugar metabolism
MSEQKMPAVLRHDLILKKLNERRFGTTVDFARWLSVSEMTVRRDFDRLAEKGLLSRTHGGAVSLAQQGGLRVDMVEPRVSERELRARDAKSAIASHAFGMIEAEQTIALDIGTTTFALSKLLHDANVKLFTSSLKIAAALKETRPRIYIPCGLINGSEPSVVGPQAVDFFRGFYFDIAFIGASGITPEGLFDYSLEDAEIKRAFIERSRTTIALIDGSKFDRISVAHICAPSAIDIVVTDTRLPEALHEALSTAGVCVDIAASLLQEGAHNDF